MDRWLVVLIFVGITSLPLRAQQAPQMADATLHDVRFVDRDYGWAVGEHGVIMFTKDGGKNWLPQNSTVTAGLHGVWFVDRNNGWAVGGTTIPYLNTSQAIVLQTTDGGQTWKRQLALLPALERVKFFDAKQGVAWGRGSGADPLGAFSSEDGGRNWRPVAVGPLASWWGGDFLNLRAGLLVGPQQQAARIASGDIASLEIDGVIDDIHAIHFLAEGKGWLVGKQGAIARTANHGATWTSLDALPPEIAKAITWNTVTSHGSNIWIAGNPGTIVLHSPDDGASWQGYATPSQTPLRQITFVDEHHGWAAGELGTILHSSNGGKTWTTQRRGGERAAVFILVEDEQQLPLETLAKLSSDGYLTVVHLLSPRATESGKDSQLAEALSGLGVSALLRSSQVIHGDEELLAEIVKQLRIWRPDVVIGPSTKHGDSQSRNIAKLLDQAVPLAASPTSFTHLEQQLALPPWKVSRTFASLPSDERGTHRINSSTVAAGRQQTLGEMAAAARSLISQSFYSQPTTNEFLLTASFVGEPTESTSDLASGLAIAPGGPNRRPIAEADTNIDPQVGRQLAEKRRNLRNILRMNAGNPALLGQLGQMINDLDVANAAPLLYETAMHFQSTGQLDLAASCQEMISRRYADNTLADQALVWLVHYYASSETAHVYRQITTEIAQSTPVAERNPNAIQPATALIETTTEPPLDAHHEQRFGHAVQVAEHIAHTRPRLHSEPFVRVAWAVAERKRGLPDSAQKYLESLAIRYPGEAWQECGAVERWLADRTKPAPHKPRLICHATQERPQLDGELREACWNADSHLDGEQFLFAYDAEYLYLAARCVKLPHANDEIDQGSRTYDADLTNRDRVRLLLDVDRDYCTYFSLTVDHRGWTNDACWHDITWNPKWFVAALSDDKHWSIEAAIPWSQLTATPPSSGEAWALGCERIPPGEQPQSPDPQIFSLLLFK